MIVEWIVTALATEIPDGILYILLYIIYIIHISASLDQQWKSCTLRISPSFFYLITCYQVFKLNYPLPHLPFSISLFYTSLSLFSIPLYLSFLYLSISLFYTSLSLFFYTSLSQSLTLETYTLENLQYVCNLRMLKSWLKILWWKLFPHSSSPSLSLLSFFLFGQMLQSVNHAPSDLGERKNAGTREKVKRSVWSRASFKNM